MIRITLILCIAMVLQARSQPLGPAYVVKFTDKNNSGYSIDNPQEFLTLASIDRRQRQGIPILENDLPVIQAYLDGIVAAGAQIAAVSRWMNLAAVWIQNPSHVAVIQALPYVLSVTPMGNSAVTNNFSLPNKFFEERKVSTYTQVKYNTKHSVNYYNYGAAYNQINMISGINLHNQGYRGEGMVIAVLDAGFNNSDVIAVFDSLRLENRILGTRDFVQPGNNVYNPSIHPHGTNVLSVMAANLDGQMVGTAPKASYWLLRTEDALAEYLMEEYYWIAGAEFADSVGAWVINSSLGYTTFDNPSQNHTYADLNGDTTPVTIGADLAASKGMLVVNSAGNYGNSSWNYIGAPADGDSVLAVGAVNAGGSYVSFSSKGPTFDGRIKPDVCAQGQGTAIAGSTGAIFNGSGTSFSSPLVAGMAACLWQAVKNRSNYEIMSAIRTSASQHATPDNFMGFGIPNFTLALGILGIPEDLKQLHRGITLYPNPFLGSVSIRLQNNSDNIMDIEFFDLHGRLVFRCVPEVFGYHFQISELPTIPSGIYTVRIRTKDTTWYVKAIKQD